MNTYLFYVQFIFGKDMLSLNRSNKPQWRPGKHSGLSAMLNTA